MTDGHWALLLWIIKEGCTVDQALTTVHGYQLRPTREQKPLHQDAAKMARLKDSMTYKEIAKLFGVSTASAYQYIARYRRDAG